MPTLPFYRIIETNLRYIGQFQRSAIAMRNKGNNLTWKTPRLLICTSPIRSLVHLVLLCLAWSSGFGRVALSMLLLTFKGKGQGDEASSFLLFPQGLSMLEGGVISVSLQ